MNKSMWVAAVLVSCTLAALIISGATMINYVQWQARAAAMRHPPVMQEICEFNIHEAGYARILLGTLGLLAVWIPFRRRKLWAWLALAAVFAGYLFPAFLLVPIVPDWATLVEAARHAGPQRVAISYLAFPLLLLAGLLASLPNFAPGKRPRVVQQGRRVPMTKSIWVSAALISWTLVGLIGGGVLAVNYVRWDVGAAAGRHAPSLPFICEITFNEIGWARILLGTLGLLAVWIPFRRRRLWAWLALVALFAGYLLPAFLLPAQFPRWETVVDFFRYALVVHGRGVAVGLREAAAGDEVYPLLVLAGLLLSLPNFLPRKRRQNPPVPLPPG